TRVGEVASEVGNFIGKKVKQAKELLSKEELAKLEQERKDNAQTRARFSQFAATDNMMKATQFPEETLKVRKGTITNSQEAPLPEKKFSQSFSFKDHRGSLSQAARKKLDELILGLDKPSLATITIYGRQSAESNRRLSFIRAQKIAGYFRERGLNAQALGMISYEGILPPSDTENTQSFDIVVKY
ncbi:MAG: hypothetical protein KDD62_12550, partial [Bdellovibrionales bacterium]|nr:hypothetical protein [Bdellovibrionales bacterium]